MTFTRRIVRFSLDHRRLFLGHPEFYTARSAEKKLTPTLHTVITFVLALIANPRSRQSHPHKRMTIWTERIRINNWNASLAGCEVTFALKTCDYVHALAIQTDRDGKFCSPSKGMALWAHIADLASGDFCGFHLGIAFDTDPVLAFTNQSVVASGFAAEASPSSIHHPTELVVVRAGVAAGLEASAITAKSKQALTLVTMLKLFLAVLAERPIQLRLPL